MTQKSYKKSYIIRYKINSRDKLSTFKRSIYRIIIRISNPNQNQLNSRVFAPLCDLKSSLISIGRVLVAQDVATGSRI